MKTGQFKYSLLLLLTAVIWGSAFVAQSEGAKDVGPLTFNAARMILAGIALWPVSRVLSRRMGGGAKGGKTLLIGGVACGACLAAASYCQQLGIAHTTVGKAGFLTALYILIVPLVGTLFGKKVGLKLALGVALALMGMYFLCMSGETGFGVGDGLCVACAFLFTGHILVIDYFSPRVNPLYMSDIQFFSGGIVSLILALVFEKPTVAQLSAAAVPILYAGLLSSAVGYTLQIVAQSKVEPTLASLLMSLESVFSALFGWLLIGQRLSGREIFGCALMFVAIILAQLPGRKTEDQHGTV